MTKEQIIEAIKAMTVLELNELVKEHPLKKRRTNSTSYSKQSVLKRSRSSRSSERSPAWA